MSSRAAGRPDRVPGSGVLFAALLTLASGNAALGTVLPVIGRELGLRDALVAGVPALSALIFAISAPFWGGVSDRVGRKPIVLLSLASYALAMTSFGAIVLLGLRGVIAPAVVFIGMVLSRAVFGLFGAAAQPVAQAYVADRTAGQVRTSTLAFLAGALAVGAVVGPAAAPFLALQPLGLAGPILTFSTLAALMLVVVARRLHEPGAPRGRAPAHEQCQPWRDPRFRPFLLYTLLAVSVQAVNTASLGFLVLDTVDLPPASAQPFIGAAMLAGASSGLIAQWVLVGRLRMTPPRLLRWGAGLAAGGNLMLAMAPGLAIVLVSYAIMNLGFGFARAGYMAGASLAAGDDEQGAVAGALGGATGAAFIASPVLGVALYESWGPSPFLLNVTICVGLLAYVLRSEVLRSSDQEGRNGRYSPADALPSAERPEELPS